MKKILRICALLAGLSMFAGCGPYKSVTRQDGKVAIVAHRGFWQCENVKNSQNSIAALAEAQKQKLWGSECDLRLTSDKQIIVNHDETIDGLYVWDYPFEKLSNHLLNNGESRPSFKDYVLQAKKCKGTKLVIELKLRDSMRDETQFVDQTIQILKSNGMFNPKRILFISFNLNICKQLVEKAPGFTIQYLSGDLSPKEVFDLDINGIDYHYSVFAKHPDWVAEAHSLGMSVNVWTVDKPEQMQQAIAWGVDAITTNQPLVLRQQLGAKELRLK